MSIVPRLALLLGTFVLILIVGEVAARVIAAMRAGTPDMTEYAVEDLPVLHDIFEIAAPNASGLWMGVPHRTNSRGIRGPDYSERPAQDVFRILIAGDSVTMGSGVREGSTYPVVLERLLNESDEAHPARRVGRRFEVLNLGLAGVNAGFSTVRLERLGDVYHPDLTIYGFTLNDIEGPSYRKLPPVSQKPWRRALRFGQSPSYLLRELWPRWIMLLEYDAFHPEDWIAPQAAEWFHNYFEVPSAWGDFAAALGRQAATAEGRGICAHVLIHTHLTELSSAHRHKVIYDKVSGEARKRGLTVTESLSYFVGRDNQSLWVNSFDLHPNAEGHAILAQALFEGLRELPASCWQGHSSAAPAAGSSR